MNLNKVFTVIAGYSEDSGFNYTCFIAENLSELLPNFSVRKVIIKLSDWKDWLINTCKIHGWSHTNPPLIWRESGVCGGDFTYIGGKVEFQKFISHYYGIDIALSKAEEKALNLDYLLIQDFILKKQHKEFESDVLYVTISGAGRTACPDLVAQLATTKGISEKGMVIALYDVPGHFFKLKDVVKDATAIGGELRLIKLIENLSDGLTNCDVLIILDHLIREDEESINNWLQRNNTAVKEVAEQINIYAPSDMKVIFCSMGPICFCANVMAKEAVKLDVKNIVAVSANYGLELMYHFLQCLNIDNKSVGCPPVWGFLGINHYIDIHHVIQKYNVYVPNKRALSSSENSTLSLGTKYTEFRWLTYLSFDKKPHKSLAKRKSRCLYHVGRNEDFQKCKAICDLLQHWYKNDDTEIGDEIISLGIPSDGTFNMPKGIYFSQPVHLKILDDNSRAWVRCPEFPLPKNYFSVQMNFMETAKMLLKNFNIID